jgi:tetratricopeptide (TPR) repeat protein
VANDFPKAIDYYKRLTEVAATDPRTFLLLGQAYMANKNWSNARDAFKASFNLSHTPDALVGLAAADQQSRNFTEAIQIYEAIDKNAAQLVKANPDLLFNMGNAYKGANQPQKAKAAYVRFLAFLKPGTQGYGEVKQLIADVDRGSSKPAPKSSAKPVAKATAKPGAKPKPTPSAAPKN